MVDGQELPPIVSGALDQLLKSNYGSSTDLDGGLGSLGEGSGLRPMSPLTSLTSAADGSEYFDFSSFAALDDDIGSKAETPDLVQSTNLSPGSGSDLDIGHTSGVDTAKIVDPKEEEPADLLHYGVWKEVGGEAPYHGADSNIKWDGGMPLDQSWAFTYRE